MVDDQFDAGEPVPASQKLYYGLGQFGSAMLMGIFNAAVLKFYIDVVQLSTGIITIIFALFMVWNTINDPIFGYFSDSRKPSKNIGKRLPWMRVFNPFLVLFFALTWFSPLGDGWVQGAYLLLMLLLYDTGYTIVVLNFCALLADMSTSTIQRSKIQLVGGVLGAVAAIVSIIVPSFFLTGEINLPAFQTAMVIVAIVCFVTLELCAYKVKIRSITEEEKPIGIIEAIKRSLKNKSFVALVTSNFTMVFLSAVAIGSLFYFTEYVLGVTGLELVIPIVFVFSGCVLGMVLLMRWIKTSGVKAGMLRGMIMCGIGLVAATFLPGWAIYIAMIFVGVGIIMPLLTFNVLVGELADEEDVKTGTRREGMFFGFNALVTKPANSIGAMFIAFMLDAFGYITPEQVGDIFIPQPQDDVTVLGIRILFGLVPGILVLLGAWIFSKYDLHGERLAEVKRFLKERDLATREQAQNEAVNGNKGLADRPGT